MIIILSAFGLSGTLAAVTLWISYQAIAHNLNVNDAIQLMQVSIPIATLVIGSVFGFIAGRQVKV